MMADTGRNFTSKSTMLFENGAYRFHFACELCDNGYTTGKIVSDTVAEALEIARLEARPHFNCCHKCHHWICDDHYNIDEMMCVSCAPLSKQTNKAAK